MEIDCLILGAYQTNCYILRDSETAKDCLIVDAGLQAGELIDFLQEHKLNPVAVVLSDKDFLSDGCDRNSIQIRREC